MKAGWIEAEVWDRVSRLFLEPDTLPAELLRRQDADSPTPTAIEAEFKAVGKRLATISVQRDRILDQVAKGNLTDAGVADWSVRVREEGQALEDRRSALRADLAAVSASAAAVEGALALADHVRQGMGDLDNEGRAEFFARLRAE